MTHFVLRGGLRAPALALAVAAAPLAAQQGPRVYAPNQAAATVSVIDVRTNRVLETIDLTSLGFAATARPHHTQVAPDGRHWYVSMIGEHKVAEFDRDNHLTRTFDVPQAGMISIDPAGSRLLVAPSMTAVNPPPQVALVDCTNGDVSELDVLVPRPHGLVIHPDGRHAYVSSVSQNQFVVVDLQTEQATPVAVDGAPNTFVQFALSPDGSRLVVTGQLSGDLLAFDVSDPAHPRYLDRVHVGAGPYHPVFSPDGRRVYVAVQRDDAVAFVDARTWRLERTVRGPGLAQPHGVVPTPDGRWLYVSNENVGAPAGGEHAGMQHDAPENSPEGRVVVIDTRRGTIARTIATGRQTTGLSFAPALR